MYKAVVKTVGEFRKMNSKADEVQLTADAIRAYNSRFTAQDLVKFEELMTRHDFPQAMAEDKSHYEVFIQAANGNPSQYFAKKCHDLDLI